MYVCVCVYVSVCGGSRSSLFGLILIIHIHFA